MFDSRCWRSFFLFGNAKKTVSYLNLLNFITLRSNIVITFYCPANTELESLLDFLLKMKNLEKSRIFFVVLHGVLDFFAVVLLSWTYGDVTANVTDFLSIMWTLYLSISATSLFLMM